MSSFLLGLGANLGDPVARLVEAVREIERFTTIDAVSSIYRTEPVGFVDQADFYNIVCRGSAPLSPADLLAALMAIESRMGRRRTVRNGPRSIDIDVLAFDDLVIDTPTLIVPHPRMGERTFVLVPLREIAPSWRHPITGLTANEMLEALPAPTRVDYVAPFLRAGDQV